MKGTYDYSLRNNHERIKMKKIIAIIMLVFLIMTNYLGVTAEETNDMTGKKTIVLVHGGWHGEWSWYKVNNSLVSSGYNVVTIELPSHGNDSTCSWEINLKDYEQTIINQLDSLEINNTVLVGHGTSGVLISRVAEMRPDLVEKIIFVGGVVASDSESISSILLQNYESVALRNARVNILEGEIYIKESSINQAIYNTIINEEDLRLCRENVQGEPLIPLLCEIGLGSNYDSVPKYYVRTLQDNCVTPSYQQKLLNKTTFKDIYEMDTCHMPFISNPDEFVSIIEEIANIEEEPRIMMLSDPIDINNIDEVTEIHNKIVEETIKTEMSFEEYMKLFEGYQDEISTSEGDTCENEKHDDKHTNVNRIKNKIKH